MFNTIKEKLTPSEETKMIAKQIAISLAVGVAVSLTVNAITMGFDAAKDRIAENREAKVAEEA